MDNEKLTKSQVWRQVDKFISTVTNHWTAYIEFADTGYIDANGIFNTNNMNGLSSIASDEDLAYCKFIILC